eukprot:5625539-Amphidinium_carterae.1
MEQIVSWNYHDLPCTAEFSWWKNKSNTCPMNGTRWQTELDHPTIHSPILWMGSWVLNSGRVKGCPGTPSETGLPARGALVTTPTIDEPANATAADIRNTSEQSKCQRRKQPQAQAQSRQLGARTKDDSEARPR